MSKKERNFLFCGCIFAGLLGGIFENFFGVVPNVGAIIALTVASFMFSVAFMVAFVVWFNSYKTLGALSNCIQYPTNPY